MKLIMKFIRFISDENLVAREFFYSFLTKLGNFQILWLLTFKDYTANFVKSGKKKLLFFPKIRINLEWN